jgi:hypothetical protein
MDASIAHSMAPEDLEQRTAEMATTRESKDQRAYTKELIALFAGGLTTGLATSGLALIAPEHTGPLSLMALGAIMGLAANFLDRKGASAAVRLVLGVGGGVAMALLFNVHILLAAAVGGLAIGAAFSLEHGSKAERALVSLAYAGALAAAVYTSQTLLDVGFLRDLKDVPLFGHMTQATIWGLFLMLPAGLKHLQWEHDEMLTEFRAAKVGLDDKHVAALNTGEETYKRILDEIEREGSKDVRERAREIALEVSRGLIELTRRSHELHDRVGRTQMRPLEVRARELESRIRSTRDAALRRELVAGLGEVIEQMRSRRRLEAAVARIEARQQRYLTALDRLHVTLVQNDSLTSSEGALTHSLDELSRLTDEVKYKNLSVDELIDSPFEDLEEQEDEIDDAEIASMLDELQDLTTSAPGELPKPRLPRRHPSEPVTLDTGDLEDEDADLDEQEQRVVLDESAGVDGFVSLGDDADPSSPKEVQEEEHVEQTANVTHSR